MIKETKTTKTIDAVTKSRFCDDCGKDITHTHSYMSSTCILCGKDICHECVGHEEYNGDYPEVHCNSCWSIGEYYRNKIQELEDEIDMLNNEWVNKCKEN